MKRADHASLPVLVQGLLARDGTAISWADLTWNPWMGCTKVGPACDHCYAEELMGTEGGRYKRVGWGPGQPRLRTAESNWTKPLRWQRVAAAAGVSLDVFCLSLGDWADKEVEDRWRLDLADVILRTPNLRWLLLTKRIPNVERYLRAMFPQGVPPNVCLGITVVTQAEVDRDLPRAVAVKKALGVRRLFLSMEPLLQPIVLPTDLIAFVDLVIVGGESGKDARPLNPGAVEALEHQCDHWLVPFHFKQWGEFLPERIDASDPRSTQHVVVGNVIYQRVGTRKAGRRLHGIEHLARIPA
ncbi:MAG: DUF5131 family protein [Allosphingosinicella sp.]